MRLCRGCIDRSADWRESWAVRYRGRRTRKLTLQGRYPVLSLAKARQAARAALERITDGEDPAVAKHAGTPADDTWPPT